MMYGTGGYAAARLSGSYSCADTGIPVLPDRVPAAQFSAR